MPRKPLDPADRSAVARGRSCRASADRPASPWSSPATVAGFSQSPPNPVLVEFAESERQRAGHGRAIDLGCGAGRNAIPLAHQGWLVTGLDLSLPMLLAAKTRVVAERLDSRVQLALAAMDRVPARDDAFDLVVAHGIWNLARSGDEFRGALRDASRAARSGAGLFVFTFSRRTLPSAATPVAGERFVFTQFSGNPQCFLTEDELRSELAAVGFAPDPAVPLHELNVPKPGTLCATGPVIFEGTFRKR